MNKRIRALILAGLATAALTAAAPVMAATYKVSSGDMYFKGIPKTVKAGTHTFVVKNVGKVNHDLKIGGKKTVTIKPGKTAKITVSLKKGKAAYICTIPGHAAAGMKGSITVK